MKKTILFTIAVLVATILACNFSASTANIADAKMAIDPEGTQPTTVFAPDETLYCVYEVANAPDDTKTKIVWTAVEAEGIEPNSKIGENEQVGGGTFNFSISNNSGDLPVGKYKADLYLNDKLDRTLEFEVQE